MSRRDPTNLQAEQQANRDRELAQLQVIKQQQADLRWLMGDARGRRIAHRLIERAGIYQSTFEANASVTAFREGRRAAGLEFLSWITQAAPKAYLEMLAEHTSDRSNNDDSDR